MNLFKFIFFLDFKNATHHLVETTFPPVVTFLTKPFLFLDATILFQLFPLLRRQELVHFHLTKTSSHSLSMSQSTEALKSWEMLIPNEWLHQRHCVGLSDLIKSSAAETYFIKVSTVLQFTHWAGRSYRRHGKRQRTCSVTSSMIRSNSWLQCSAVTARYRNSPPDTTREQQTSPSPSTLASCCPVLTDVKVARQDWSREAKLLVSV